MTLKNLWIFVLGDHQGPLLLLIVFFPVVRDQNYKQTSHEVQLISDSGGPLNYTLGLFYIETEANMDSGPA